MKKVLLFQILFVCFLLPAFGQQSNDQSSAKALYNRLDICYAKALDAFEQNLYVTALQNFKTVGKLADSSYANIGNAWSYIGRCEYQLFEYATAIEAYQKAVAFSPEIKTQDYYSQIGMAYVKNQQLEEAHLAFTEYEKLYPARGETYRNWAVYYALQGDKEKAISHLQKAVDLGFNDLKWLRTDSSMFSLRRHESFIKIMQAMKKKVEQEGI